MTIASLIVDVAANTVKLQKDVEDIHGQLDKVQSIAGSVGKAIAAAFTVTAIVSAGREVIDYASHVTDLGQKLGVSTSAVQKWELAFGQSGISIDTVASASTKLSKNLIEGDKSAVGAMTKLGLSVDALKKMSPEQQFNMVADAVGKIENPTEKAYAAMTLFGKGGAELLAGLDGHLTETTSKFEQMGLIIDEKTIAAADDFGDQLGVMGKQFIAIVATIVGPLLPALSAIGAALLWVGQNVIGPVFSVSIKTVLTLLGLFWEGLSSLLGKLAELATHLPIVGKHLGFMATAADWLKESSASTTKYLEGLWKTSDDVGDSAKKATPHMLGLSGANAEAEAAAKKLADAWRQYNSVGADYLDTVRRMSGATVEGIKFDLARGQSQEVLQTIYGVTAEQIKAIVEVQKLEIEIGKILQANRATIATANEKIFADQAKAQKASLETQQDAFLENVRVRKEREAEHADFVKKTTLSTFDYQRSQLDDWIDDEEGKLDYSQGNWLDSYKAIHQVAKDKLHGIVEAESAAFEEMRAGEQTWSNGFKSILGGLPGMLQQALTGGGGLGGFAQALQSSIGAMAGQQLITGPLTSMFNSAAPALLNTFGSTVTTAIGGAIPLIGPAIGALAPMFIGGIKKLFGSVSEEELKARESVAAFERQLGSTLTVTQQAEAGGKQWAMTTIAVRDAYLATGRSASEADLAVRTLWDSSKLGAEATKAAIDQVNAVLKEQQQDQARAKELIDEYHISIDQLGPAFRAQELNKQAHGVMEDFRLMVDVLGIDAPDAMVIMKDKINDFVHAAISTGTEVPAAMRPMLEKMASMGLLTDDSGDKITDLKDAGLTFAETLTQGVDRIVAKFDQLMEKLGLIGPSMAGIPKNFDVAVNLNANWNIPELRTDDHFASTGGLVTSTGIQHFAGGGVVLPFVPRGSDTVPAMLTPGEMVLNRQQQAAAFGGRGGQVADFSAMRAIHAEIKQMRQDQARRDRDFPRELARAVRDASQGGGR